jgi:hypothetical protein
LPSTRVNDLRVISFALVTSGGGAIRNDRFMFAP